MLSLCSLFSGSSGNASLIRAGKSNILVDCGASGCSVETALKSVGCEPDSLTAILVTHEHIDHIRGVGVMSRRYNLPVYATHGTWECMIEKIGRMTAGNIHYIQGGVPFGIGDAVISPFSTPHDAKESVGFAVEYGGRRAAVATDIGVMNMTVYNSIKDSDMLVLESNHDIDMLMHGPYPNELKERIRGSFGHLSNVDSALTCARLLEEGVKHIILGHLSADNNLPEVAYRESKSALESRGAIIGRDVTLEVAGRREPSHVYEE